jgi:xylulokinase
MFVLGIDLGTSALKAVLVDERQAIVAEAAVPLRTHNPRPGWSEQDPEDWWAALLQAMQSLRDKRPDALSGARALGLSGQMHGAVLLDRHGASIRPAILWNDGRAAAECNALEARVPNLAHIAGIGAMPGFTAPKLLWLRTHEPQSFARIWKVLSPKDFLRFRLTGTVATEMSDAAGTLWLDEAARDWSDPILFASGLTRSEMPALVEGTDRTGEVASSLLAEWGIVGPVVVAGGAGDAAAAGIGIGAVDAGDAFISLGTSGQLFVTDDRYRPQPETTVHAYAHALPGRWFRMAAMLNGARCLEWVAQLTGEPDIVALLQRAEAGFRGPSAVLFLPYLSGERTPHNDPDARGVFFGMDPTTRPSDLVQATLEGVAFSFLDGKRCLEAAGIDLRSVAAVGGGARSRFWMQLFAHVLGVPVVRYGGSEQGPAFGAARVARLALTGEVLGEVCAKPPVEDVLQPDLALHDAYGKSFEAYRALYCALKPEFARAASRRGLPPTVDLPPPFV